MRMVERIALSNLKYHKSKNILTGIAIFLTTVLLFLVPTMGMDLLNAQKAAVNMSCILHGMPCFEMCRKIPW